MSVPTKYPLNDVRDSHIHWLHRTLTELVRRLRSVLLYRPGLGRIRPPLFFNSGEWFPADGGMAGTPLSPHSGCQASFPWWEPNSCSGPRGWRKQEEHVRWALGQWRCKTLFFDRFCGNAMSFLGGCAILVCDTTFWGRTFFVMPFRGTLVKQTVGQEAGRSVPASFWISMAKFLDCTLTGVHFQGDGMEARDGFFIRALMQAGPTLLPWQKPLLWEFAAAGSRSTAACIKSAHAAILACRSA